MAIITKISTQKKAGYFNIFLDGQYSFSVSEEVLIAFNLHKGQELTKEVLSEITAAKEVDFLYQQALGYLSYQLRSQAEIETYLKQKNSTEIALKQVLQKLQANRLIDDLQYAQSFVRTMAKTSDKGPKVIRNLLRQKGIGENLIDKALTEFPLEQQQQNLTHLIPKLMRKYQNESALRQKQKVKQALLVKGFNSSLIDSLLAQHQIQVDPSEQLELLKKQALKAWNKNQRYDGYQRLQKTKQFLYRKGFDLSDIEQVLNTISTEN